MKNLSISITTESPLSIRSDHASEGAEMTNYIPSTTLIGALATTYKLMYPENTASFERLFLSGEVSFPHLYPASYKTYKNPLDVSPHLPIYPVPKTALTCKRHKGFLSPADTENDAHGVRDTLIIRAIFKEWGINLDDNETDKLAAEVTSLVALNELKYCLICKEPTDHYDGYYRHTEDQSLPILSSETYKHLETHTGINRFSGTVENGVLYNRQVFNEGTQFWGLAKIADAQLGSELKTFLDEIGDAGIVRLGTGRTRGMGKITLRVNDDTIQAGFTAFQQRLNDFQKSLQEKAAEHPLAHMTENYYFALTLHSPAIINDELLGYHGTIDEQLLKELLTQLTPTQSGLEGLKQVYQQASLQRITGWQELWGTPKMNEYAIEAGSVFLFKCPMAQRDHLHKKLYILEEQGIGKRRLEGFGRICISDTFHQEVDWK